jgi:serine/threonine protein kinase
MAGYWPKTAGELTFDKLLGKGFFGEVWSCHLKANSNLEPIAVKKIPLNLIRQHNLTQQMEREIKIQQKLEHPHIVKFYCDFRDDSHIYLGMELSEGGGMFNSLSEHKKFSLKASAQYFYETCDALEYLHTLPQKIIHRDIKPENILFDKGGHVKLADFGWSNMMQGNDSRATFCGTPDYLAPEMIRGEGHNESLDMWEMGVLLYEMVTGKSPFGASS